MFKISEMLSREVEFCKFFTQNKKTDYGILYYNTDNPLSYDSNHAQITRLDKDLTDTVQGVIEFYKHLNVKPRIYCSYIDNELEQLRPALDHYGFTIEEEKNTFMLSSATPSSVGDYDSECRRVTEIDQDILDIIYSDEDDGEWTEKVNKINIRDPNLHMLALYHQGRGLAMASVKTMQGYSRVDDVKTHNNFRRQRFGTRLINFLIRYHQRISGNHLYLYANNPIAIHMYERAGFDKLPVHVHNWSAYLESA